MREIRQQDIVWVRFPYSDMSEEKFRPAVVASNDSYNRKSHDVIVCAITSKLDSKAYSVLIDDSMLSSGSMPLKSRIRADKIIRIEKGLVVKPFARLNNEAFDELTNEIMSLVKRIQKNGRQTVERIEY